LPPSNHVCQSQSGQSLAVPARSGHHATQAHSSTSSINVFSHQGQPACTTSKTTEAAHACHQLPPLPATNLNNWPDLNIIYGCRKHHAYLHVCLLILPCLPASATSRERAARTDLLDICTRHELIQAQQLSGLQAWPPCWECLPSA